MIQFLLQIFICTVIFGDHHNLAEAIPERDNVTFSKTPGDFHLNATQNRDGSKSHIKIINGKSYFAQTFKPVVIGSRRRKLVTLREPFNLVEGQECKTPNNDTGRCIYLKECPVLKNIKNKEGNKRFIISSICDKNGGNVKYCCGKYENFKYLLPLRPLPKECGYDQINRLKKPKIFGGTEAMLGEFPWLARIIHTSNEGDKSVGCEGFLIHKRFILTAAHCVKSPRLALVGNITEIQLGEHNTQTEQDCIGLKCADPLQTMKVKSIIPHPDYRHNSRDHHYDIALIYLKGEVKFSDYVQPICLLDKPKLPVEYWISGWGKTEKGTYSDVKMKVSIPPFDIVECNKLYSNVRVKIGQSQFCAGGQANKDSCVGDSGGPLMLKDGEKRWYALGLVSFGISCGLDGWPGVYTSIPFYYDWIIREIIQLREPELLLNMKRFRSDVN